MAQADIAAWAEKIKQSGLLQNRGDGDRDWVHVGATDGSIMELRLADVYTRVVWSEKNPPATPFAFWSIASRQHPLYPKTDFLGTAIPPQYFAAAPLKERFARLAR